MTLPRLDDVLRDSGVPDLIEILARRLSGPELEVVLLEVHRQRVDQLAPREVLAQYDDHSHVQPSTINPVVSARITEAAFQAAVPPFEPLDLSPICPQGSLAVLAPVDPAAAWAAGAMGEVVSDCVSVLALECARRRQKAPPARRIRLCADHRELHVPFSAPLRSEVHARVFGLCTGGPAGRADGFEAEALREQIEIHLRLLERLRGLGHRAGAVRVEVFDRTGSGPRNALGNAVIGPLAVEFPAVGLALDGGGYSPLRHLGPVGFVVAAEDATEVEHVVGLGGLTDWTRQLLGREEEGLLVSTIATERLCEAFGT